MSKGKYSPSLTRAMIAAHDEDTFIYNADGQIPPEYVFGRDVYDQRTHFGDYDKDGYDRYGYSAFNQDGKYIGLGSGIDRWGYTEMDYLQMDDDDFMCVDGPRD